MRLAIQFFAIRINSVDGGFSKLGFGQVADVECGLWFHVCVYGLVIRVAWEKLWMARSSMAATGRFRRRATANSCLRMEATVV